jgi:hypothetical protein
MRAGERVSRVKLSFKKRSAEPTFDVLCASIFAISPRPLRTQGIQMCFKAQRFEQIAKIPGQIRVVVAFVVRLAGRLCVSTWKGSPLKYFQFTACSTSRFPARAWRARPRDQPLAAHASPLRGPRCRGQNVTVFHGLLQWNLCNAQPRFNNALRHRLP